MLKGLNWASPDAVNVDWKLPLYIKLLLFLMASDEALMIN
jgi:hypothetical protein